MADTGGFPLPYKDGQVPGFPASLAGILFQEFAGMNTKATRPAIKEEECSWISGFMPIGPGNLRTMYGLGPVLYTAPTGRTIQWFNFGNIGSTPYGIALLSDGSLQAVNTNTKGVTQIAAPGTVTNPSPIFGFSQWGQKYFLFASQQTNGYWIWDGTTFYMPGQTGPDGKTVATGISGSTIETYSSHVWVGNGAQGSVSAPGFVSDFTTNDGATSFQSTDSFLRRSYIAFKQTNGFLYLVADSSINQISNVQTSGSPPATTFINNNVDPQQGTPWPGTVQLFSRNIVFANSNGVYVCYGGAVTRISDPLDGIYNTVPSHGPIIPTAAVAEIFGISCYVLLLPIVDPFTGLTVNKLLLFDGRKWWASDQDLQLTFIATQEIDAVLTAYGTDGRSIYPLFTTPSVGFTKVAQSKFYSLPSYIYTKTQIRLYGILSNNQPTQYNLSVQIESEIGSNTYNIAAPGGTAATWTNASGAVVSWTNASGAIVIWGGTSLGVFGPLPVGAQGQLSGMTAISTAADLTLISLSTLLQHFTART